MALSHNLHTVFSWLNLHDVQFLEIKSLHWSYITGLPVYIFIFWHVEEIIFHQPAVKRHLYSVNFRWKHYSNRWMGGKNNTWFQWVFTNNFRGCPVHFPLAGWFHAALSFIAPCRVSCVWARILLYTFSSWFVQINIWMFSETASRMIYKLFIHSHPFSWCLSTHGYAAENRCALPYTCAIDNHAGLWACHITSALTTRKWHQVSSCFLQRMNCTSVVSLFVVPKAPSACQYLRKQTV